MLAEDELTAWFEEGVDSVDCRFGGGNTAKAVDLTLISRPPHTNARKKDRITG